MCSRAILAAAVVLGGVSWASAADSDPGESEGPFLGALFSPIPEALYAHLPQLPAGTGVLVTHVLPQSPAAQADIRRHDLLLRYDGRPVRDCEHLARLIQNDEPGRGVQLELLRQGRREQARVTLARGPALRIASAQRPPARDPAIPRGVVKPTGPAPVSLAAVPLPDGRLRVTIEYYDDAAGRLRTLSVDGATEQIARELRGKLPEREWNLARVGLERLRALSAGKAAPGDGAAPEPLPPAKPAP